MKSALANSVELSLLGVGTLYKKHITFNAWAERCEVQYSMYAGRLSFGQGSVASPSGTCQKRASDSPSRAPVVSPGRPSTWDPRMTSEIDFTRYSVCWAERLLWNRTAPGSAAVERPEHSPGSGRQPAGAQSCICECTGGHIGQVHSSVTLDRTTHKVILG